MFKTTTVRRKLNFVHAEQHMHKKEIARTRKNCKLINDTAKLSAINETKDIL